MTFPSELLPNESRKLIDCVLDGHYLIRYTDSKDGLWDEAADQINSRVVCSPKEHVVDLSTSILSVYEEKHVELALTKEGINEYGDYCAPDITVDSPIYEQHFVLDKLRGCWFVPINSIHEQPAEYTVGPNHEKFSAICQVVHTPMKWNFWHFSIRWKLSDGRMLNDLDEKERSKLAKRLGGDARGLIAQYAVIVSPELKELPNTCYTKAEFQTAF